MASRQEGSNDFGSTSKRESGRRSWTPEEEEALLAAMKHLVVSGWKSDNGFRPGFNGKLVEAMRIKFPDAHIKANPHIISKITTWKRAYFSIMNALSRSGVGYNLNGDHKIDCNNEQWEAIINADSYAKNIRDKSFPLLDGWIEVFGKDRAMGDGARDIMEMVNGLMAADSAPKSQPSNVDPQNDGPTQQTDEDNVGESMLKSQKFAGVSKKRKSEDGRYNFCELLSVMHRDTIEMLQSLVGRIGYQVDLRQARKEVYTLLSNIPNLSLKDQFADGHILVKENDKLEYFVGLPEEARSVYIKYLLEN